MDKLLEAHWHLRGLGRVQNSVGWGSNTVALNLAVSGNAEQEYEKTSCFRRKNPLPKDSFPSRLEYVQQGCLKCLQPIYQQGTPGI